MKTHDLIEVGKFKAWVFNIKPMRMESAYGFNIKDFSSKLVYTLMDITHKHGFSCSGPLFEKKEVIFSIGAVLPSKRSINKYSNKLNECLNDIAYFDKNLRKQIDFTFIDLSMFKGINFEYFDPVLFAKLRDEFYQGSWKSFQQALIESGRKDEAELIKKCEEFELKNNKDIALVGKQLDDIISLVESSLSRSVVNGET